MRQCLCILWACLLFVIAFFSFFIPLPASAQLSQSSSGTRFGVNAEEPINLESAYTDVFMEASWSRYTIATANGYPLNGTEYGAAQCFYCLEGDPPGLQTYNFYGEGIFNISFAGGTIVPGSYQTTVNSAGIAITTCQVTYNIAAPIPTLYASYTWMNMTNINPQSLANGNPNNFHLTRPGYPKWQYGQSFYPVTSTSYPIFTTSYLNSYAPFCCIRFMDWMNTNNNTGLYWTTTTTNGVTSITGLGNNGPFSWANRPNINMFGQTSTCYENMIALCNATGCDLWMNVPLQATDDWKVGFANLVTNDPIYHLNPWLHIYYEHGNELWNSGFMAWQWIDQQASIDFEPGHIWAPLTGNSGLAQHGYEIGKQIMQDINIMQPIFNQVSSTMGRPILAGQYSYPNYNIGSGLIYISNTYGPPQNYLYGIAGAPYFGDLNTTDFTGVQQTQMQICMGYANQYGIKMCAYEAGQSLDSSSVNFNTNLALQETPAMADQYLALANMWKQNGGDLMNFFTLQGTWNQYGYWGMLPTGAYMTDLSDPVCTKYNTAASFNNLLGCNCGNAQPPPPPTPSQATAPAPATATPSPSSSLTPVPVSPSSPTQSTGSGHWADSSLYGKYWVWDNAKMQPDAPHH